MTIYLRIFSAALLVACATATSRPPAASAGPTKASCATENVEAIARTSYPAEWPKIAVAEQASGTAVIKIDLSASGAVTRAAVVRSTGNESLDRAAEEATLSQTFAPEVRDCTNVGGSYLFEVDFPA